MPRAPYNVLVIPFRSDAEGFEYAVFYLRHSKMCQFIAGGGESGEDPELVAKRETLEEAGIEAGVGWVRLDARASIPRTAFPDAPWPEEVYVIPEISFAVNVGDAQIRISHEHEGFKWVSYEGAREQLTWDSNKVALYELRERLKGASDSRKTIPYSKG